MHVRLSYSFHDEFDDFCKYCWQQIGTNFLLLNMDAFCMQHILLWVNYAIWKNYYSRTIQFRHGLSSKTMTLFTNCSVLHVKFNVIYVIFHIFHKHLFWILGTLLCWFDRNFNIYQYSNYLKTALKSFLYLEG